MDEQAIYLEGEEADKLCALAAMYGLGSPEVEACIAALQANQAARVAEKVTPVAAPRILTEAEPATRGSCETRSLGRCHHLPGVYGRRTPRTPTTHQRSPGQSGPDFWHPRQYGRAPEMGVLKESVFSTLSL